PNWRYFATVGWGFGAKNHHTVVVAPTPSPTPRVVATPVPTPHVVVTPMPTAVVVAPTPKPTPLVVIIPPTPKPTPLVVVVPVPTPVQVSNLVIIKEDKFELKDGVHFTLGGSEILVDSYKILDAVAATMKAHPEIALVRIEG